jgi:Family of unknown function (DUF5681)
VSRSKKSGHSKSEPSSNYAVGYMRPPLATRFRAGGVGNPKGRPKKKKTVGQTIDEALTKNIKIKKNGRWIILTAQEHIIQRLVEAGARGDLRAINAVFALQHRYKESHETTLNAAELDEEDRKILEEYGAALTMHSSALDSSPQSVHPTTAEQTSEPTYKPTSEAASSAGDAS